MDQPKIDETKWQLFIFSQLLRVQVTKERVRNSAFFMEYLCNMIFAVCRYILDLYNGNYNIINGIDCDGAQPAFRLRETGPSVGENCCA